jgi:hypothetical protein
MNPSTLIVKEKYSNQEYSVQVVKNQSIKIDCTYKNRINPKATSVTLKVNDSAEYDSYNTSYIGKITAISEKVVTIQPRGETSVRRLKINEFCNRNWDFNLEKKVAENNAISMTI